MYLLAYFVAIKPIIINASNIGYNSSNSILFVLILVVVGIIFGLLIKKVISYKSSQHSSITNEIIFYIFSHILILPILLLMVFI